MVTTSDLSYSMPVKYRLRFYSHDGQTEYGRNVISFDGDNDFVDCGSHTDLWSQSLTRFSFAFWFYAREETGGTHDLVTHDNNGGSQAFRCHQFNTDIAFKINFGAGEVQVFGSMGGMHKWHHIVCTYDSTLGSNEMKIYRDGLLLGQGNTGGAINLSAPLRLGEDSNGLWGYMRDFRFWDNTNLSLSQVLLVMQNDPTAPTPDYWLMMDEGTGDPVDSIGGKTTTLNNMTPPYGWTVQGFISDDPRPPIFINNAVLKLNTIMHSLDFEVDNSDGLAPVEWFEPGNLVTCEVWKNGFLEDIDNYLFIGQIDFPNELRVGYEAHTYKVSVVEIKQTIYDSNVTFIRNAPVDTLGEVLTNNATSFRIWRLIKDLFTNKQYTLLKDDRLQDRFPSGWFDTSYSGLSQAVDIIFPRPRIKNNSAGAGIDEWAELIGFNFYFDYPDGIITPVLRWPQEEYVKIVLKAGDTKDPTTDDADLTAYITEDIVKESSSSQEGNFANMVSAISKIDNLIMAQKTINSNSTLMNFKAIAQPFTTQETDFTELQVMLSKQGDPQSPQERFNGAIFVNVGNKPVGKVLDFEIPLSDIDDVPTNIMVDLTERRRYMKNLGGQTNFYIVFYQRSNGNKADGTPDGNGSPNNNTNHGVRVHRDNATNGGSLIAEGGDKNAHTALVWKPHGPNYVFVIKSSINRLFVSANQESIIKVGKKEPQSLDFGFIEDVNTAQRYLSSILYFAVLYKMQIPLKVTVPNNFLFKPYMKIPGVMVNKIFPGGIDLEIQEVEYKFADNNNECSITCMAMVDEEFPSTFGCENLV